MKERGYGSIREWNICPEISLDNAILSVYYCDYLQLRLCDVIDYSSASVDWHLDQIKDI